MSDFRPEPDAELLSRASSISRELDELVHPTEHELKNFLDEQLSEPEAARIDTHVADCEHCQSRTEELIDSTFPAPKKPARPRSRSTIGPTDTDTPDGRASEIHQIDIGSRYVVLDEIDRGGMGVVYRAFDRELKREIAIKIAHAAASGTSDVRFYREAQIAAQLQHPGIVPVHQTGRLTDGRQYIAMKLVRGRTLSDVIHAADAPQPAQLFNVFNDVCNAMAYAHSRDIIHRDLKPDNLMVGTFGEVQIMDWGLARKLQSNAPLEASPVQTDQAQATAPNATSPGDVFGTPAYMPPEQARGDAADKRTDVFALGGILYEILTGTPPFDGPTATAAIAQSLANDLESAFDRLNDDALDPPLIALVKSCLAPTPADRPEDAQAVSRLFGDYLAGREQQFEESRLEKARAKERLIAQQKRIKTLLWSGGAILATVIGAAVVGYGYLTEKNARIADQARIEGEELKRRVHGEAEIRNILSNARLHQAQAANMPPHERHTVWTLAVKEIEKGTSFTNDTVDARLRTEFEETAEAVQVAYAVSKRRHEHYLLEDESRRELGPLFELSYLFEDMRLCNLVDLLPRFADTFERLGIRPGVISQENVDRLSNSPFKAELILGLMSWNHEIGLDSIFTEVETGKPLTKEAEAGYIRTRVWLDRLIDRVDPDPFRSRIRDLARALQPEEIIKLSRTDEAVSSLLTVHTVTAHLNYVRISTEDRVEFLLRAHQKFPTDFVTNWMQPAMSGRDDSGIQFSLACYSLRPENPGVLRMLGTAYLANNEPALAIEPLQELTRVAPWYHAGYRRLAVAHEMLGDVKEAEAIHELADQKLEAVRPMFEKRIEYHRARDRTQRAASLVSYLAGSQRRLADRSELNPERNVRSPLTEKALAEQERLGAAIDKLVTKIQDQPTYRAAYGRLENLYSEHCQLLLSAGRPDLVDEVLTKAVTDFESGARLAPDVSTPHERLATLCRKYGRLDVAITSLKQAIAIHPDYGKHYDDLQSMYRTVCDQYRRDFAVDRMNRTIDEAIASMAMLAQRASPDKPAPHERLARFAEYYRRYDDAIAAQKRASDAIPSYEAHRLKLAELYLRSGQQHLGQGHAEKAESAFGEAAKGYQRWADKKPNISAPHERLSEVYEYQSRFVDAMKHLRVAIGIHPKYEPHRDRYLRLAMSQARLQMQDQQTTTALETLTAAFDFVDGFETVYGDYKIDAYDLLSQLHKAEGNLEQAIQAATQIVRSRPGDHAFQHRLAGLFVEAKQPDKAESIFRTLYDESPDSEHTVAALAGFYLDHGEPAKAAAIVKKSHAAGVSSETLSDILKRSLVAEAGR